MINNNGTLQEHSEKALSHSNRGLAYGDALFETIRYSGGKLFFWEDHYFRLMASMRIMRMEIPMNFTMEFLEEEIVKTIKASSQENNTVRVKMIVWRTAEGKYTPTTNDISYLISTEILETSFYTLDENFYEVELFKDFYINAGLLSTIKSNNKLINVLGSIYAKENDYNNCLLLNEKKQVVEALNGNLFLVNGYKIKTPPLTDGCLNGVMRKQLIAIIGQLPDYILEETSISPFELQKADELFITNVITGLQPISKYRKKEYETKVATELLSKINVKARLG
ncbi:aminotransferase class IV [Patiriisocius hiemis]|uniref:branched-chain-amino-acid transaminase n=1 Tax=Patiriisocius hiemis TaxID=3075604 RepID=A0ABU2Y9S0_9FLAO|nr:aminotransferase class IV [Constantimarinum sp. W242]MDT0554535.1 aminotransferase class IV [Constantimarinum sp. W242]